VVEGPVSGLGAAGLLGTAGRLLAASGRCSELPDPCRFRLLALCTTETVNYHCFGSGSGTFTAGRNQIYLSG
jgi:hypothetical protein